MSITVSASSADSSDASSGLRSPPLTPSPAHLQPLPQGRARRSPASTPKRRSPAATPKRDGSSQSSGGPTERAASAAQVLAEMHLTEKAGQSYERGAHIKTWLGSGKATAKGLIAGAACEHHGIYVSDDEVIHFTREHAVSGYGDELVVEVTTLAAFGCPHTLHKNPNDWRHAEDIVFRARSSIGNSNYALLGNNCEHFATWCRTGVRQSEQVTSAAAHGVAGGLPGTVGGGVLGAMVGSSTSAVATVAPTGAVTVASGGTVVSIGSVIIGCATGLLVGGLIGGAVWAAVKHVEATTCGGTIAAHPSECSDSEGAEEEEGEGQEEEDPELAKVSAQAEGTS